MTKLSPPVPNNDLHSPNHHQRDRSACTPCNRADGKNFLDLVAFDLPSIKTKLLNLEQFCYVVENEGQIGVTHVEPANPAIILPPLLPSELGDRNFQAFHGVKYAYATGAMAGGIACEELVIALGRERILGSFGAGGLSPARIESAINRIQQALPGGPYAFNLIHSPNEPALEQGAVDLYLKHKVKTIEASAFLDLTPNLVYYRAAGLNLDRENRITIAHKIIAKLSRQELATKFLHPAPTKILKELVDRGLITEFQAKLAEQVPMADDITVEADSGGHTDNRPLVCLFPAIVSLRDEIQQKYNYPQPVRIGVAGGIGTPQSALAALMMGAAYVVTGSI
ncbi:MAG: 2-nitropropane dioxygenase, partial [Xenococcaceae cyanobacterium]